MTGFDRNFNWRDHIKSSATSFILKFAAIIDKWFSKKCAKLELKIVITNQSTQSKRKAGFWKYLFLLLHLFFFKPTAWGIFYLNMACGAPIAKQKIEQKTILFMLTSFLLSTSLKIVTLIKASLILTAFWFESFF